MPDMNDHRFDLERVEMSENEILRLRDCLSDALQNDIKLRAMLRKIFPVLAQQLSAAVQFKLSGQGEMVRLLNEIYSELEPG